MANSSRTPYAIKGIKAKADQVVAAQTVTTRCFYGPNFLDATIKRWFEIGVDDPELAGAGGLEAARATTTWAGLGAKSRDQTIIVSCAVTAWNGESTEAGLQAAVDDAYALLADLEDVLTADPTIAENVLYGGLSQDRLRPAQTEKGSIAYVLFDVECRARLTRF